MKNCILRELDRMAKTNLVGTEQLRVHFFGGEIQTYSNLVKMIRLNIPRPVCIQCKKYNSYKTVFAVFSFKSKFKFWLSGNNFLQFLFSNLS